VLGLAGELGRVDSCLLEASSLADVIRTSGGLVVLYWESVEMPFVYKVCIHWSSGMTGKGRRDHFSIPL
jgi:hypothetical protein